MDINLLLIEFLLNLQKIWRLVRIFNCSSSGSKGSGECSILECCGFTYASQACREMARKVTRTCSRFLLWSRSLAPWGLLPFSKRILGRFGHQWEQHLNRSGQDCKGWSERKRKKEGSIWEVWFEPRLQDWACDYKVTSPWLQSHKSVIAKSKKGWCNEVINHSTCIVVICVGPTEPCGGISGIRTREQLCDVKKREQWAAWVGDSKSLLASMRSSSFSQHENF